MTTEVTVKVPTGADYEVEMDLSDTADKVVITTYIVKPGQSLSIHIYSAGRYVSRIAEVSLS